MEFSQCRRALVTFSAIKAKWVSRLIILSRRAVYLIRFYGASIRIDPSSWISVRSVVRVCGGGSIVIGRNCQVHPFSMLLTYGGEIRIGDNCSINPFTIIYGTGGAHIGNGVRIAAHCVVIPENHNPGTDQLPMYQAGSTKKGIWIEDNVWIGAGVRILDGVRIGRNAIVGAGSVVTKSLPPDTTAVGLPARAIKTRHSDGNANR